MAEVDLMRESQLFGTLNVNTLGEICSFGGDELALLNCLTDQATEAIEKAQLRQRPDQAVIAEERDYLTTELNSSCLNHIWYDLHDQCALRSAGS